jgi:hypothetical protein
LLGLKAAHPKNHNVRANVRLATHPQAVTGPACAAVFGDHHRPNFPPILASTIRELENKRASRKNESGDALKPRKRVSVAVSG